MALELIRFDEKTNKFEVPPHALNLLRSLNGSICVLAICGRSREGKSFLLNLLVARLQGASAAGTSEQGPSCGASGRFAVGSTVKPCTRGLWLWSQPLQRKLPSGQTCNVLLLDAEGIDAYNQTADYSNHVFSLAMLLSSVLIYNQMGSIDESSVENLARVCESARLIGGKADAGAATGRMAVAAAIPTDLSPAFVWLLRDFHLHLQDGGRQLTYRDYMERVLAELPGTSEAIRTKNQIRASIKMLFPDRDCYALVRPINDEARLAKMDTLSVSDLRPEFRKGLDSLVGLLLQRCRPKTLHGRPLTGSMLAGLAEAYCRVINEGHVPTILSTWQAVVQAECRCALDMAVELYRKRLGEGRGAQVNLQALEAIHTAALEAAVEAFRQKAIGSDKDQEASLQRLRETAASLVEPLRHTKRAEAQGRALELLEAEAMRFKMAIFAEDSDLTAAVSQLHDFLLKYGMNESLGPDKYVWVAEFLAGSVVGQLKHLAQETRTRYKAALERIADLEARVEQDGKVIEILRSNVDDAAMTDVRRRRELAEAKAEAAAARDALTAAEDKAAVLRRQLEEAKVELEGRANAPGVARLQSELVMAKAQQQAAEAEARAAKAARTAAVQQLTKRTSALATEVESARQAMEAAKVEAQGREESLAAQLAARDATVVNLERERDALLTSMELLRTRPATVADAVLAYGANMAAHAASDRGASGCPAAAAGAGAGAGAGAANTTAYRDAHQTSVIGLTSTPPRQAVQGKRGRGPTGAGPSSDGGHDDDVVMVEAEDEDGPVEVAPEHRPTRRRRTAAAGQDQQQSQGDAAATPLRTAAAGGTGIGAASTADRSPFSLEREVVLSRSRVWIGSGEAAATMTASPVQAEGHGATSTTPHRRAPEVAVNTMAAVAGIDTPPASATAATEAGGSRPQLPPNISSMTVDALKDWLTSHGWEEEVFAMSLGRKVTRKEWADVVRWKCSGGPTPLVLSSLSRGAKSRPKH